MRHSILLLATLAILGAPTFASAADVRALPCSRTRTDRWSDGSRVTRCWLSAPAAVDGTRYDALVAVDASGRVRYGRLAADAVVQGAALPARSWVSRDANGAIEYVFLPDDREIDGHRCRGGGHDYMTLFHPNGRLRTCWLDEDEVIDGVPCRDSGFFLLGGVSTEFHEDGRLAACTLRRELVRDGVRIAKGTRVGVGREGRITGR